MTDKQPKRWRRRVAIAFGILAMLFLLYIPLFSTGAAPEHAVRIFSLSHARGLAASSEGALPVSVGRLVVASESYPRNTVMAGFNMTSHPMVFAAFQVRYPDRAPVIIDAPHDLEGHGQFGENYDQDAYEELQRRLAEASRIVITHEHVDHARGISQSPHFADIAGRVFLTAAQRDNMWEEAGFTDEQLAAVQIAPESRAETGLQLVAPGIVRVPAPGHSPGSVFYFVKLQSGRELLFVGDTAWSILNVDRAIGKPWLVSRMIRQDREATLAQLRELRRLRDAAPALAIVPAHDNTAIPQYIELGVIEDGFIDPPEAPPAAPTPLDEAAPGPPSDPAEAGEEDDAGDDGMASPGTTAHDDGNETHEQAAAQDAGDTGHANRDVNAAPDGQPHPGAATETE